MISPVKKRTRRTAPLVPPTVIDLASVDIDSDPVIDTVINQEQVLELNESRLSYLENEVFVICIFSNFKDGVDYFDFLFYFYFIIECQCFRLGYSAECTAPVSTGSRLVVVQC